MIQTGPISPDRPIEVEQAETGLAAYRRPEFLDQVAILFELAVPEMVEARSGQDRGSSGAAGDRGGWCGIRRANAVRAPIMTSR